MPINQLAQLSIDVVMNTRRATSQLVGLQRIMASSGNRFAKLSAGISIGALAGNFVLIESFITLSKVVKASFDAFTEFEKKLLDVEKIAKTNNLNALAQAFKNLSREVTGVSFSEIADAMGEAARAGIQGADALEKFTATALRFAAVAGDITGQEAAKGLAILRANFKLAEEDVENLAAGIDALSDNFVITSGEILKTSARLAGLADSTNLSKEDLNALSTTLLSTGQTATVVRTSISKLLIAMTANTSKVGGALRMTVDEFTNFSNKVQTEPLQAIKLFTEALSKLTPAEQNEALVSLGIASSRVSAVIKVLQGSLENLDKAQKISNEETQRGTALMEKHFKVAQSGKAQLVELGNQWNVIKGQFLETQIIIDLLTGSLTNLEQSLAILGIQAAKFNVDVVGKSNDDIKAQMDALAIRASFLRDAKDPFQALKLGLPGLGIHEMFKEVQKQGELQRLIKMWERLDKILAKRKEAEDKIINKPIPVPPNLDQFRAAAAGREDFEIRDDLQKALLAHDRLVEREREFFQQHMHLQDAQRLGQERMLQAEIKRQHIIDENIKKLEKERRANFFQGAGGLGPFAPLFNIMEQVQALNNNAMGQNQDVRQAMIALFAQQAMDLSKRQEQPRFKGLTQAWKDATTQENKRNTRLLELQLRAAEAIAQALGHDNPVIIGLLRQIAEREGLIQ